MTLDLDIGNQETTSKVSVEMNKSDLHKMISSLEAANKVRTCVPPLNQPASVSQCSGGTL